MTYICFDKVDNHGHRALAGVSVAVLNLFDETRKELVTALEDTEAHERLIDVIVDDLIGQALGSVRDKPVRYEHTL